MLYGTGGKFLPSIDVMFMNQPSWLVMQSSRRTAPENRKLRSLAGPGSQVVEISKVSWWFDVGGIGDVMVAACAAQCTKATSNLTRVCRSKLRDRTVAVAPRSGRPLS